jgi:hypothetical protein
MEPEIRYTTTSEGVSIAYYTMGEGYPWFPKSRGLCVVLADVER